MEITLSHADKRKAVELAKQDYTNALEFVSGHSDGYCFHGKFVGGSGADLMCGLCEAGDSPELYLSGLARYELALGKVKGEALVTQAKAWIHEQMSVRGLDVVEVWKLAEAAETSENRVFTNTVNWLLFR